jgi:adenylate cyclase
MIRFGHVRERKLVQWALAYLAGAWLLLQLAGLLSGAYGLPRLFMQAVPMLLVVGFFAALVLAWYHGEKGEERVTTVELGMLVALLVLAGAAVAFVGRDRAGATGGAAAESVEGRAAPGAPPEQGSIAVLPFADMSPEGDQEYFTDGITEEILNVLAQVPVLRVPARTSSFAFKGQNLPIREVARQLEVAHVLEGSVRKAGDRLRITAQLIDARTDEHLWSETYDRELDDVFAIQEEIARAIVRAIEPRLAGVGPGTPAQAITVRGTSSAEAHDLYLLGLSRWNERGAAALREAEGYFRQATAIDPQYAPAYAGLASVYAVLPSYAPVNRDLVLERGRTAALRAIELDSTLAEAHAALGYLLFWAAWDWDGGVRALRRATELNPSYAPAYHWLGLILAHLGRLDEAERLVLRAIDLDPLNHVAHVDAGSVYGTMRRYDRARELYRRSAALDPDYALAQVYLFWTAVTSGRLDEAREALRRATALAAGERSRYEAYLAVLERPEARPAFLATLRAVEQDDAVSPRELAGYYALLGEREAALAQVERCLRARCVVFATFAADPVYDLLESDPRFHDLLASAGLRRVRAPAP